MIVHSCVNEQGESREIIIKGRRETVLKSIPWTFHALTFNEESLTLFQRQVQTLGDDHPSYDLDDSESTGESTCKQAGK